MPPAAALLERILTEGYIPGMARAAGIAGRAVAELNPRPILKVVEPQQFAIPRPEKPKELYLDILGWEGEENTVWPRDSGYEERKYEYLRHGGGYVERVLAQSRAIAYLLKTTMGCQTTGDAPSWPPAPGLVEQSKRLVYETIEMTQQVVDPVARRAPSPATASGAQAGFFVGRDGLVWPLPPRECMASPADDFDRPAGSGQQWNKTSRSAARSSSDIDHEPTSGFFIDEDGIAWPLPPRECMGSTVPNTSRPAPRRLLQPTAPSPTRWDYNNDHGPEARPGHSNFFTAAYFDAPGALRVSRTWSSASSSAESTGPVTPDNGALGLDLGVLAQTSCSVMHTSFRQHASVYGAGTRSWSPLVEDNFFSWGDDSLSPLSLPVKLQLEEDGEEEHRGRSPTPRWSVLWG